MVEFGVEWKRPSLRFELHQLTLLKVMCVCSRVCFTYSKPVKLPKRINTHTLSNGLTTCWTGQEFAEFCDFALLAVLPDSKWLQHSRPSISILWLFFLRLLVLSRRYDRLGTFISPLWISFEFCTAGVSANESQNHKETRLVSLVLTNATQIQNVTLEFVDNFKFVEPILS